MITFEDMIDRLEKNSGQTVVSLKEAKMLLKVRMNMKECFKWRWMDTLSAEKGFIFNGLLVFFGQSICTMCI